MDTSQNNTKQNHNQIFMVICSVPQGIFVLRSDISRLGGVWHGMAWSGAAGLGWARHGKGSSESNTLSTKGRLWTPAAICVTAWF